jgi:hypothetical protein
LDVANGHVGINGTSNINWDTVGAGTWMLTAPKLMIKGPTMAESTLIGAATISPANPVLELVTAFPFSGNSSYMGIEFELIEGNGKRAVISASFVFGSLGNIASHEMSLNGNADPAGISVWIGTDAGVVKISMQDTLLGGNANVSIRVIHRTATVMESYAWTVTALPSPPAWTSNPTPNTQLITGNQSVNRFGQVNINTLTVAGSASVGGALAVVGPVTGASFTSPSDVRAKKNIKPIGSWLGDLFDNLEFGTFEYNGQFGFVGPSAGVTDAEQFRTSLPEELRELYAPQVDHKDPEALSKHKERQEKRRLERQERQRERQSAHEERRKKKQDQWAARLERADDKIAEKALIDQEEMILSVQEEEELEEIGIEEEIELASLAKEFDNLPTVEIGMVNNSLLLALALAEIKSLRERVKSLEKKGNK